MADLQFPRVMRAMVSLRREPGRRHCPLPADIRAAANPMTASFKAQAEDIAGRVLRAVSRFGYTSPRAAEDYVGPIGWRVIERQGGWARLCNTLKEDDSRTFYAQVRDQARAQLELDLAAREDRMPLALPRRPADPVATGALLSEISPS